MTIPIFDIHLRDGICHVLTLQQYQIKNDEYINSRMNHAVRFL